MVEDLPARGDAGPAGPVPGNVASTSAEDLVDFLRKLAALVADGRGYDRVSTNSDGG
jgi:hypothetical protein